MTYRHTAVRPVLTNYNHLHRNVASVIVAVVPPNIISLHLLTHLQQFSEIHYDVSTQYVAGCAYDFLRGYVKSRIRSKT